MTEAALFSLGSINADFQMRVPDEIGEIETQLAHDFRRLSGGKAANRTFLARRYSHPARLFGRVGDDELARQALGTLEADGADISGVTKALGVSTAVSVIVVPPSAKKRIFLAANANACWDAAARAALEEAIMAADPASVLAVDFEAAPDVVDRAVSIAARRGLRVVIDPSPGDQVDREAIGRCAAIAPNVEEAAALTGLAVDDLAGARRAALALGRLGAPLVCIKLADGGAVITQAGGVTTLQAPEVEVVDTTGAGDAFSGALAIGLFEGRGALEAACLAVAAATVAVTAYGSQHERLAPASIEPLARRVRAEMTG